MRLKYGTTNIIRNATGMEFTGTISFPRKLLLNDFIPSLIMSCVHTAYEQLMFMPL
jgi:hypothetical protein